MEQIGRLLKLPEGIDLNTEMSFEERLQIDCVLANAAEGHLAGEDCPVCRNKGLVFRISRGTVVARYCDCMEARQSRSRMRRSGLGHLLEECTFENFEATEPWQQVIRQRAMDYAARPEGWLLLCGQVGCGKTHLCTAVVGELLRQGRAARYMRWRDEVVKLRACVNDGEEYSRLLQPLKEAEVLYIDDFFKSAGREGPTTGDRNIAFELINARYAAGPERLTILSSERTLDEILQIDDAVGSRIYQRTKGNCLVVARDSRRNYRLRDCVV